MEPGKIIYAGNLHLQSEGVGEITPDYQESRHRIMVRDKSGTEIPEIRQRMAAGSDTPILVEMMEAPDAAASGQQTGYSPGFKAFEKGSVMG